MEADKLEQKHFMKKDVGLLMAYKKNENKGDDELTLSKKKNSLKTHKYMTAILT